MANPGYPILYQVNTRVWLKQLSLSLGKPATLADIPDRVLDDWQDKGFDWIYLLGVWQTGTASVAVSRSHPEWCRDYQNLLPNLQPADICGSGFAITGYTVNQALGGNHALVNLRERLHQRGLQLMLDFVPNHRALDHPWVQTHPEFYVRGTQAALERQPQNYGTVTVGDQMLIFAYGRDSYFPGWPDTWQLNYGNLEVPAAMLEELWQITEICDGIRCDMAMLLLPEIFERTWGIVSEPFWPGVIATIKAKFPQFVFMAEVYWDLEGILQQQGFDYTYDKKFYDHLRRGYVFSVREHLQADVTFQSHLVRFLENHDEPRAAAVFAPATHKAAAILTFLSPGLRFFHQGQLEGWQQKISVHLCRGPLQETDFKLQEFYTRLLHCLRHPLVRVGSWQLLDCYPAWSDNWSYHHWIAFTWQGVDDQRWIAVVNYADQTSQCYVRLPWPDIQGKTFWLDDLMSSTYYQRTGDSLLSPGLYLDAPGWAYHVFELTEVVSGGNH